MELTWNDESKETYIALKSVVNNGGYFKSYKQGQFLINKADRDCTLNRLQFRNKEDCSAVWKVDIDENAVGIWMEAGLGNDKPVSEGGWGSRSRRIGWMFIVDEFGVQEMYKLKFWHAHSTGSSGPKKAVLEFTRETADTTELEYEKAEYTSKTEAMKKAVAEQKAISQYVGSVKERIELEGTMKFITSWIGDYGTTYLFTITDDKGNIYKYMGKDLRPSDYDEEKRHFVKHKEFTIKSRFTIKKHEEYRGEKQTIINRPAKTEVFTSLAK